MKTLSQFCVASVLTLMLTLTAFAGQMDTGIAPPPPPPSDPVTQGQIEIGVAGDIHTGISDEAADDSVVRAALGLLQGVLSLI